MAVDYNVLEYTINALVENYYYDLLCFYRTPTLIYVKVLRNVMWIE